MTLTRKTLYTTKCLFIAVFKATRITLSATVAMPLALIARPESMFDIMLAWVMIMGFIFEAAVSGVQSIIHDTTGDLRQ